MELTKGWGDFGEFFKKKRIQSGKTLRSYCVENGLDPAYISRVENGLLSAPSDKKKLNELAKSLMICEASEEWSLFMDLAAVSRKEMPDDIATKEVVKYLPAFYRTLRKKEITEEDVKKIINLIKGG